MTAAVVHKVDLTSPPGDGLVYAEILTEAGIIRVNVNLVKVFTGERRVVVEVEPNMSGIGRLKTEPGGQWDIDTQDHGTRTDLILTRKEGS
jgi:hypothetical protein